MIAYNMRYRGPMEYDKFILNFLQYYNEVNEIFFEEFCNDQNTKSYEKLHNDITTLYNKIVGDENLKGINEQLQEKLITMKGV